MALVAMCAYDPPGESRADLLRATIQSFIKTVNFDRHRLFIVSNGVNDESKGLLEDARSALPMRIIDNDSNRGTARAVNQAWQHRMPGENCLKADSDIRIHEAGWLDKLEECVARDPKIGIIGLKRKDLDESPHNPSGSWSHSTLHMLPHKPGQTWLVVEKAAHVMGTVQLYNSALLDKIGYLYQLGGIYAFDDSLAAARCKAAGFYSCFWPHVEIDHIDPGGTPYTEWKQRYAGERMAEFTKLRDEYLSGKRSVWHGPEDE